MKAIKMFRRRSLSRARSRSRSRKDSTAPAVPSAAEAAKSLASPRRHHPAGLYPSHIVQFDKDMMDDDRSASVGWSSDKRGPSRGRTRRRDGDSDSEDDASTAVSLADNTVASRSTNATESKKKKKGTKKKKKPGKKKAARAAADDAASQRTERTQQQQQQQHDNEHLVDRDTEPFHSPRTALPGKKKKSKVGASLTPKSHTSNGSTVKRKNSRSAVNNEASKRNKQGANGSNHSEESPTPSDNRAVKPKRRKPKTDGGNSSVASNDDTSRRSARKSQDNSQLDSVGTPNESSRHRHTGGNSVDNDTPSSHHDHATSDRQMMSPQSDGMPSLATNSFDSDEDVYLSDEPKPSASKSTDKPNSVSDDSDYSLRSDHASNNGSRPASQRQSPSAQPDTELLEQFAAVQSENKSLTEQLRQVRSELEQTTATSKANDLETQRENADLLTEIERLRQELVTATAAIQEKEQEEEKKKEQEEEKVREQVAVASETQRQIEESLRQDIERMQEQLASSLQMQEQQQAENRKLSDELIRATADLRRSNDELRELKVDLEEYEEAMSEKEGLVEKLTEALDSQLDKVDMLELKLHRAEQEFVKMEDELKEMEEEIIVLRDELDKKEDEAESRALEGSSHLDRTASMHSQSSVRSQASIKELKEQVTDMERKLYEDRMAKLAARERSIDAREMSLMNREDDLDTDREAKLEEWENELFEMEGRLKAEEKKLQEQLDELDVARAQTEAALATAMASEDDGYQQEQRGSDNDETSETEPFGTQSPVAAVSADDSPLRTGIAVTTDSVLRDDSNNDGASLVELDDNDAAVMHFDRPVSGRMLAPTSARSILDGLNHEQLRAELQERSMMITELQEEIAELREKIVEKEREVADCQGDIETQVAENEELRQEVKGLEKEISVLRESLKEDRLDVKKKLERKDDSISFMQSEMVRLTKEKQVLEETLRMQAMTDASTNIQLMQRQMSEASDEAELERIQAINSQLRELDEENRKLQDQFALFQDANAETMKKKDEHVAELLDEIAELKEEMDARKEADYVNLLNDRKELKKEQSATKKELRAARKELQRMSDTLRDLESERQDMQADIEDLKTSLLKQSSRDYVSSLKRQLDSLKSHNKALERKLCQEKKLSEKTVKRKEETICFLQKQITTLKESAVLSSPRRGGGVGKKQQLWSMLTPMRKRKDRVSAKASEALSEDRNSVNGTVTEAESDFGDVLSSDNGDDDDGAK